MRIAFHPGRKWLRPIGREATEGAFPSFDTLVVVDVLDLLIAEFGPVDEPGFDDSEIDPSFLERWW